MAEPLQEFTQFTRWIQKRRQVASDPLDQANRLELQARLYRQPGLPYPPSPFIIITQPKSWYSFYRPMEGTRLSRPRWLLHTEMVYPPTDGHPSKYQPGLIIIIIIIRHAPCQCIAPLATNSLHSNLSKASSIASSKVRLFIDRSLFKVAIQEV